MHARLPRYSMEEHVRKGQELYHQSIEPHLGADLKGQIVALDIDSGAFEVAPTLITATDKLLSHDPDAQIWCERVGFPAVHKFGARMSRVKP
jgi:hypothetical protein